MMHKFNFLRSMVLSVAVFVCAITLIPIQSAAQHLQQSTGAQLQRTVFGGSTQSGWYSFPGQSAKVHFSGDAVCITSRKHSTVMLSRGADTSGSSAEVALTHAPISTSSISGLGVVADADHAMVIGLEGGNVVLWQLDPGSTKIITQQPVNATSPLEFRVVGGDAAQVRFFWRHNGDSAWHPLGDSASNKMLAKWSEPLHFGLLLDGPQGSQVTFSNYRAAGAGMSMTAMLQQGW